MGSESVARSGGGRVRRWSRRVAVAALVVGGLTASVAACSTTDTGDAGGRPSETPTSEPGELTAGSAALDRLLRIVADTPTSAAPIRSGAS